MTNDASIVFFDSGIGGISVLREAISHLPYENFIYYGDYSNTPYGNKTNEEILALTKNSIDKLTREFDIKAIVIACNTATSAGIDELRKLYENSYPVIGMEPAVNLAHKLLLEKETNKSIAVLATPATIRGNKYKKLRDICSTQHKIYDIVCDELASMIEEQVSKSVIKEYLKNKLSHIDNLGVIVLGCTHYSFVKSDIQELVGADVDVIDGAKGTVIELENRLEENKLKRLTSDKREIIIIDSVDKEKATLAKYLLYNG